MSDRPADVAEALARAARAVDDPDPLVVTEACDRLVTDLEAHTDVLVAVLRHVAADADEAFARLKAARAVRLALFRELREARKVPQVDVAEAAGVSPQAVSVALHEDKQRQKRARARSG